MNIKQYRNELIGLAGLISFGMLCAWPYQQILCYKKYQLDACSEHMQITTGIISGFGLVFFKTMLCYYFYQKCAALSRREYTSEPSRDPNLSYLNFIFGGRVDENSLELEQL